jgi:preprotein translocase subunit SecG
MDILVQIVQVLYVLITVVLILVVLLQAGRGGGLGTALGGGASQSVFGGSGGADFLAKLTQGLAVGFMICAVYLAYASAHSGSSRLQEESKKNTGDELLADDDEAVDYERVGPNPLQLPPPGGKPVPVDEDSEEAEVPAEEDAPVEDEVPADEPT